MEALKLILILVAIVVALRRRLSVGITLFGAGLLTALLFAVPISDLLDGYWVLIKSERFIFLTALVVFVTILGNLLKDLGFLDRLAESCRGLYGGSRTAVSTMPGLVGLMPMPGGSLLSAPLVNSVLQEEKYTPHFKCAVNYWFRHLVEFSWPIYAGLVLTEAITGMPIGQVSFLQFPLTVFTFLIGLVFFIRKIDNTSEGRPALFRPLLGIAKTIWPVVSAILIHAIFGIDLMIAIVISIVALAIVARPPKKVLLKSIRQGFSVSLVFLIFGILSFQTVLELSGSIESISNLATAHSLPPVLVIFIVMFTIGVLTGMVSAYVGLGYTLLAGLLYQPEIQPGYIMLAYLFGFIGMILSPSHLCLILTNNYFGSDLGSVLKILLLPLIVLGLCGYLLYLSGWATLFV